MSVAERRPRALVLANRLPYPLDDGWKVRSFHMIRSVAALADTTLLIFHPTEDGVLASARIAFGSGVSIHRVPAPRPYTVGKLLRGLVSRTPVHVWNQESPELADRIAQLADGRAFDICVTEAVFMYRYMLGLPRETLRIIDTHNIDSVTMGRYARAMSSLPKRLYARITAVRFRSFERRIFEDADLIWVCSEAERALLARELPTANVHVIPNGVDTGLMAPSGTGLVKGRLVFFGRLDYFPNVDGLEFLVTELLPRIRAVRPDVELHVVGPGGEGRVAAIAAGQPGVVLRGRVDDLRPVIEEAEAVVVPLRVGGGTRLKILEALSLARAVISTSIGAEGLDLRDGHELLLADSPDAFVAAVLDVISNPVRRDALGAEGRAAVRNRYDWSNIGELARSTIEERLAATRSARRHGE